MLMIKNFLEMPAGERFGGVVKTIKTTKKKWQVGQRWVHQVVLTDETGDMLADVKIEKNIPLTRGSLIRLIVAEIQQSDNGKKLFVDQFSTPSETEPPETIDLAAGEYDRVVRSKIKCWLVAATIQSNHEVDKNKINELVDYIME